MEMNLSQQNWASGELSGLMEGRAELPAYKSGARKQLNFISETSGGARYRNGSQFVNPTRRNKVACLIPFQFNDSQAYELEFTENFIRFYRNNQVLTLAPVTITNATQANPVKISAVNTYADGDEVIITGVSGMHQINNRNFVVKNPTGADFELYDTFGTTPINGLLFAAYVSGGQASKIYEKASPYLEADLFALKYGQNADVMYIVHPNYEPRKLTRSGALSWTLALFTRTGDPFLIKKVITNISQANPAKVTSALHGYTGGEEIIIEDVAGMTQINSRKYTVVPDDANHFDLLGVDSTGYTAYGANGYASNTNLLPGCVAFISGRLLYGYSDSYPESFWGSKPLDANGNPQYDDLTNGPAATDGFKFTLSPFTGKVDTIEDMIPCLNFLAICTFEGISKVTDGAGGTAFYAGAIDIVPAVIHGVAQSVKPILMGLTMVFIHRTGLIMYSLEFDIFYSAYNAIDKNLLNEHITESGIKQMFYAQGRPPMLIAVRNDGVMVWTTFMAKENINGAHRHIIGGSDAKVLSVGVMPRTLAYDQIWFVAERTINHQTVRYVEYVNDQSIFPDPEDFFTGVQAVDDRRWRNAVYEIQKQYVFADANATYDGSDYATMTMTPGAVTGNGINFTASTPFFTASMIGRELRIKSINGVGSGRAVITGITSNVVAVCNILADFDSTAAMAIGNWYLTTDTVNGLWFLEGETVSVLTDGGQHADLTVVDGTITLQYQASSVQVGLGYLGMIESMPIEQDLGGQSTEGMSKNINRVAIHFANTLGAKYGSSLYALQETEFRTVNDITGRPSPPCTDLKRLFFEDTNEIHKKVFIVQDKPLPCTILGVAPFMDIDTE